MSIIYSYPEQGALNANDMLIGTSAEKVGGKQKNITRNFSVQQIADFINGGAGFIDPVASDFQIAVFNQAGKKITGSIMSQDAFPNGTGITISGNLTTTGNITTPLNLTANGVVSLGGQANLISLNSVTKLGGPIQDATGTLGNVNQILLSNGSGVVTWQNYEAGLTYEGTWDANANTTNGLSNSPALLQGVGVSGHFYIVNVEGTTSLGPGLNDWHVGDWAVFLDEGGQPASWQKIDNTSVLTGSGTDGVFARWTDATTINDSLMSQVGTEVIINGELKVKDTIQATTGPSTSLKLKGVGTGGIEIMSADGFTDGKIQLNCSQNSHGVTLQSPPHASGATYTLVLPTSFGGAGDVLTSAGVNPSQLVWTTPTTGTVTSVGLSTDVAAFTVGSSPITSSGVLTLNKNGGTAGQYIDGDTGSWVDLPSGDTYTLSAGAKSGTSVPLNLDAAAGADSVVNLTEGTGITLTRTSATEVTIAGSAQGVTGSGTVNKLPKFDTATSLTDSIVTQGGGTITITPTQAGAISFNPQSSSFSMPSYLTRNTVTGPTPQVGDVFNFVLTSDLVWAVGGGVIPAGTYPFTITSVGSGLNCSFNSYTIPASTSGTGYTNLIGNGSSTSVSLLSNLSIDGELSMLTNKIINVAQPTAAQDAATKQYVDTAVSGALTFKGTFDASTGTISSPGSGQLYTGSTGGVAVTKGDFYIADTAGSFYGTTAMNVGDEAIALNTVAAGSSSVSDWSVVPSAGAGVVSVLPSSTGLTSSGQPLVITPAGGTGTVTIESTAYAGGSNVGHVPAGGTGGQYLDGGTGNWSTLPASGVTSVSQGTPYASTGLPLSISTGSGAVIVSSAVYNGGANIGAVPDGGTSTTFLKGDGTWASAGGAGTITTNNFSGNGTVGPFTLGTTPSGGSTSFVDVFIDGVYQEISTYTVSGTALSFVVGSEPPTGTNIQTKTTSGAVSGALVSSVDIGQSSGNTGAVDLRIVPLEVTSGQTISGSANSLYIFTATGAQSIATVTLPGSPTLGDSVKISNLGGLANVLGANGNKIMGVAADLTINTPTAAFELIWSGSNNGWIIIGNV